MAILPGKAYGTQVLLAYEVVVDERNIAQDRLIRHLIDLLKRAGYYDYVTGTNGKGEQTKTALPCNMLWKANVCPKDATAEFREAAKACGITLKQCFAAEIIGWSSKRSKPARLVDV